MEKVAPLHASPPSQLSPAFLPFITVPTVDVIDSLKPTLTINNDKTHWIIQQFDKLYVSFNSDFQFPNIPIPNGLRFVTRGQLVVLKRSEARLALWRTQYPTIPLWFLAYRCLSLGMNWRVFTPMSNLLSTLETPASWIPTDPLPLTSHPSLLTGYVHRVQALLELPRNHHFLTMGGIAWRIALRYGPPGLFASAISGPSSDVSMHMHFDQSSDEAMVDDRVSETEISLLLGVSACGSIWPTLDIWERSESWTGEWTTKAEMWFQRHIKDISSNSLTSILTRQQWKAKMCQHTIINFSKPTRYGTEAHAASVYVGLQELFPPALPITLHS